MILIKDGHQKTSFIVESCRTLDRSSSVAPAEAHNINDDQRVLTTFSTADLISPLCGFAEAPLSEMSRRDGVVK